MYASFFTYNLSRSYPYRWFTPVVLVFGLIATVLFSVINLAVNGYQLKTIYVTDPNATESQGHWYTSGPFGLNSKLKPSCQPQNLLLGTQLFTSNQGLSYTITKIQHDGDGIEPALLYLNNTLEDCRVDGVIVNLGRSDQSPPSPPDADQVNWWTWADSSATASATCAVKTNAGKINVTVSTTINPSKRDYDYVLKIPTDTSSVWWATRVANLYFVGTIWTMTCASTGFSDILFDRAQFRFTLNNAQTLKGPDLFNLAYDLNDDDQTIYNAQSLAPVSQLYNNAKLQPNVSATATEALGFAKAFYSLVLVDLGQKDTPNLFLDEDLKYALDAPDDIFRTANSEWVGSDRAETTLDANEYCMLCAPNDPDCNSWIPMNKSYAAFKDQLGPLNTTAATIYMQYSCSVPQARSGGTVFVTVLLADLVFLQALWSVFSIITAWFMRKRYPESNFCERCLRGGEDLPLVEMGALHGNIGIGESVEGSPQLPPKSTSARSLLGTSHPYQFLRPSIEA